MGKLAKKVKLFAFDLDGTLYVGEHAVPGAAELIRYLRAEYQVVFFTNNSAKTSAQVHEKLNKLKIECALNEVYTASSAAAEYLKEKGIDNVYVVGSQGFRDELRSRGVRLLSDDSADHLVVGLDFDFSYNTIATALAVLLKGGKFIACNEDRSFPVGENRFLPGCGAMVGAIAVAANKKPDFVVGKPNTYILKKVSRDFRVRHHEIMVVGDSYESDIKMALRNRSKAVLIGAVGKSGHRGAVACKDIGELLSHIRRES